MLSWTGLVIKMKLITLSLKLDSKKRFLALKGTFGEPHHYCKARKLKIHSFRVSLKDYT